MVHDDKTGEGICGVAEWLLWSWAFFKKVLYSYSALWHSRTYSIYYTIKQHREETAGVVYKTLFVVNTVLLQLTPWARWKDLLGCQSGYPEQQPTLEDRSQKAAHHENGNSWEANEVVDEESGQWC